LDVRDFIVVDMPEIDDTQIIFGRPILATAGCHIDIREGRISFVAERRFAVFSHRKEDAVSPHSSILDALPLSPKCDMEDVLYAEDPPGSEWISYEDPDQVYVKVEFSTPMPPNKLEVEAPISNDSSLSEYCRFARVLHSMPPLEGFDANFDIRVDQVDVRPSDGPRERFVLYTMVHCGTKL